MGGEFRSRESTVQTDEFVSTLEIPTDAEIVRFPLELEVSIAGGGLDAAVTLSVSTGSGFQFVSPRPRFSVASEPAAQEISGQQPGEQISVDGGYGRNVRERCLACAAVERGPDHDGYRFRDDELQGSRAVRDHDRGAAVGDFPGETLELGLR